MVCVYVFSVRLMDNEERGRRREWRGRGEKKRGGKKKRERKEEKENRPSLMGIFS